MLFNFNIASNKNSEKEKLVLFVFFALLLLLTSCADPSGEMMNPVNAPISKETGNLLVIVEPDTAQLVLSKQDSVISRWQGIKEITGVKVGEYNLTYRAKGYYDTTRMVVISKNRTVTDTVKMERHFYGDLSLDIKPDTARWQLIGLDGEKLFGQGSSIIRNVVAQQYQLTIYSYGYDTVKQSITVPKAGELKLSATLTQQFGSIDLQLNSDVSWKIFDGEIVLYSGIGSRVISNIPVKTYHITASQDGYEDYSGYIAIQKNSTKVLQIVLQRAIGNIDITINKDADWRILENGVVLRSGTGSKIETNIPTGVYGFNATCFGCEDYVTQITVQRNLNTVISYTMPQVYGTLNLTINNEANWTLSHSGSITKSGAGSQIVDNIPQATYLFTATLLGYYDYSETITINKNETIISNVSMVVSPFIYIPGGTFQMGSTSGYSDEKPVHSVTLSSYYISKYEVTVKEYRAFCTATSRTMPSTPSWNWNDSDPIVNVTWNDAKAYCDWAGVRLPTEAEWEYVARGGASTHGYTYSGSNTIGDVAWYNENSNSKVHTVGSKSPNEIGIYDMSGNVWEWCYDWYDANYYSSNPSSNPTGPTIGTLHVLRGGSWGNFSDFCRSTLRYRLSPGSWNYDIGFRVAKSK